MEFERRKVDNDNEYLILSYAIMNDDVCGYVYSRYKAKVLKTIFFSKHYRPVFNWLIIYYSEYRQSPKEQIEKIFKRKRENLKLDVAELIEAHLDKLGSEYDRFREESTNNPDFINKEIVLEFIQKKQLEFAMEDAQNSIEQGKYKEAMESFDFKSLDDVVDLDDDSSGDANYDSYEMINGINLETVNNYFDRESQKDIVYEFKGDIGKIIGPLERKWLMAISGAEKSGKSFFLLDMCIDAALNQKKRVLLLNFELGQKLNENRIIKNLSKTAERRDIGPDGKILYPAFDCFNNQKCICEAYGDEEQLNSSELFEKSSKESLSFWEHEDWKVCTNCRGSWNKNPRKRFQPALWFFNKSVREMSRGRARRAIKNITSKYTENLKITCFPRDSLNINQIFKYILWMKKTYNFHPDIVAIDYLDIVADEGGIKEQRWNIDKKWKKAAKMASMLDCLVITPDQANKLARSQNIIDSMNTSESKSKDAHLDLRIAINKTGAEMLIGVSRVNVIYHRHQGFSPNRQVMITQRLETGEPLIDSSFWYTNTDKKFEYKIRKDR